MKIQALIDKRKNDRKTKNLKANPVFAPTHDKLLNLRECYWNSKFGESAFDSRGFRKPFLNAVRVPTFVAAKATDLDTKNIRIYADEGQDYKKAYIYNKELKYYFKEINFDLTLNKITYNRPKDGHILLKKVKGKIYFVPIENDYSDPTEEELSNPMVEYHEYYPDKLKEMDWDNTGEAINLYKQFQQEKIIVWEITGEVEDDDYQWRVVTGLEFGKVIYLAKENIGKVEDFYKQLKWEEVAGRHIGRGVVEEQFEPQIAINENEYLFRLGLQFTSKKFWQTKDVQAVRNLLLEGYTGDVFTVNSPIEPIAMEERNLGAFQYADNKWQVQSQQQSFSTDVMRGARPPSGTPATTSVLQAQQAGGYYALKRQDAGIFIKNVVEDWILPDFKKDRSKKHKIHIMKLLGNDTGSSVFFNAFLGEQVNKKVISFLERGKVLTRQELELIKGLTAEQLKSKDVEIPDNFYDFKYSVDVVVTGEQVDIAQRATALQTAFQVIGSNPAILQDPVVRRTYFKLLEASGVNPAELYDDEVPTLQGSIQKTLPQGGSLAKNSMQGSPQVTNVPTTV